MSAVELEVELIERRAGMTLLERVELRQRIDRLSGVSYPPVSSGQLERLARICGPGLSRISRAAA